MTITHQDIADRIDELNEQRDDAESQERARLAQIHKAASEAHKKNLERIQAERRSTQELCGGIGHVMRGNRFWGPSCAICGWDENPPVLIELGNASPTIDTAIATQGA